MLSAYSKDSLFSLLVREIREAKRKVEDHIGLQLAGILRRQQVAGVAVLKTHLQSPSAPANDN